MFLRIIKSSLYQICKYTTYVLTRIRTQCCQIFYKVEFKILCTNDLTRYFVEYYSLIKLKLGQKGVSFNFIRECPLNKRSIPPKSFNIRILIFLHQSRHCVHFTFFILQIFSKINKHTPTFIPDFRVLPVGIPTS